MICLIQRALNGKVEVSGKAIGEIEHGLVVLVGFQQCDDSTKLEKMAHKLLSYRVFSDANGKMNLNVQQVKGGVLLVPQFTLAADTKSGLRPSFSTSAHPDVASALFADFVGLIEEKHSKVAQGQFGADMQVSLTNDGPVTFWLEN